MFGQTFSREDIYKFQLEAESGEDLRSQVNLLRYLVIELLREVEILRKTQIDESQRQGVSPKHSTYGENYREKSLLVHSSLISQGVSGLLNRWVSDKTTGNGLALSELSVLESLGYTPEEIRDHKEKVEEVATYT